MMLEHSFFAKEPIELAKTLLGKVLRAKYGKFWLAAMIIETEAYYQNEKGSHSSLGFTQKRKALFMPAGTIYMYYSRGKDSLNISAQGEGNAVLIKSGVPYIDNKNKTSHTEKMIAVMQQLNPIREHELRPKERLCSGQTLLCKSLDLKVIDWDQKQFDKKRFYIDDVGYKPQKIIQTTRLGIPPGRDEHLLYRFIDMNYAQYCTDNPLRKKQWQLGKNYFITDNC